MPHSDHSASPTRDIFLHLPPFSESVFTASVLRISLEKLLQQDFEEGERCWKACCDLGFFYLDVRTSDAQKGIDGAALLQDVAQLFEVMKNFFELPMDEKLKYDFADQGCYFGYKGYGTGFIGSKGTRDRNEFYNISKDDIVGLSKQLPPPDILNSHRSLYQSYINSSHAICMLVASLLSSRLPLKSSVRNSGGLAALHKLNAVSGDQIRFVKAPPQEQPSESIALSEHTDFGNVTVLFN